LQEEDQGGRWRCKVDCMSYSCFVFHLYLSLHYYPMTCNPTPCIHVPPPDCVMICPLFLWKVANTIIKWVNELGSPCEVIAYYSALTTGSNGIMLYVRFTQPRIQAEDIVPLMQSGTPGFCCGDRPRSPDKYKSRYVLALWPELAY
jgi:hypothetical protein